MSDDDGWKFRIESSQTINITEIHNKGLMILWLGFLQRDGMAEEVWWLNGVSPVKKWNSKWKHRIIIIIILIPFLKAFCG